MPAQKQSHLKGARCIIDVELESTFSGQAWSLSHGRSAGGEEGGGGGLICQA